MLIHDLIPFCSAHVKTSPSCWPFPTSPHHRAPPLLPGEEHPTLGPLHAYTHSIPPSQACSVLYCQASCKAIPTTKPNARYAGHAPFVWWFKGSLPVAPCFCWGLARRRRRVLGGNLALETRDMENSEVTVQSGRQRISEEAGGTAPPSLCANYTTSSRPLQSLTVYPAPSPAFSHATVSLTLFCK